MELDLALTPLGGFSGWSDGWLVGRHSDQPGDRSINRFRLTLLSFQFLALT